MYFSLFRDGCRRSCRRSYRLIVYAAAAATCAQSVFAQSAADGAPRLPDLAAYVCADAPQARSTRHVGQVIKGQYHEWYESYVSSANGERLACIAIVRPAARSLSRDEAGAFLAASLDVGALGSGGARRAAPASSALSSEDTSGLLGVEVEPLKQLNAPVAAAGETTLRAGSPEEVPPMPATKLFDGAEAQAPLLLRKTAPAAVAPATTGVDDRSAVTGNPGYPWNTLAYLVVTYPSGASYRCSATLVSPYVVLTAGHCIHNNSRGGYVSSLRVYPGQWQQNLGDGGAVRPYPSKRDVAAVQTTTQWAQISGKDSYPITDYRHDAAAIQFKTPFTHTATFMPVLYSNTTVPVTSAGYPGIVNGQTNFGLYQSAGGETSRSLNNFRFNHVREFAVDASGGNSGGAFFFTDPYTNQRYLVGSLSYGDELDDQAGGPWYDSWSQSLLASWISWVPGKETIAGSTAGLRAASVFSSAQPEMQSYLRFFNNGGSPGTVDVTLADYETGALLATWRSPVLPPRSSRQFSIAEIESNAGNTFTRPMVYSISVRPTFAGSFQNIRWRRTDNTLTNISACDAQERSPTTLINVHSSLLDCGYPSGVMIHNTSANTITPSFGIYDGGSGARLGTFTPTIAPNSQRLVTVGSIEQAAGISPGGVYHYNMRAESGLTGYVQHMVNNKAARIVTDLTETCPLTP